LLAGGSKTHQQANHKPDGPEHELGNEKPSLTVREDGLRTQRVGVRPDQRQHRLIIANTQTPTRPWQVCRTTCRGFFLISLTASQSINHQLNHQL